jgi:hypothetical protein
MCKLITYLNSVSDTGKFAELVNFCSDPEIMAKSKLFNIYKRRKPTGSEQKDVLILNQQ